MKTKQELTNEGFKFIAVNENNMEVWARFTGYEDCIQYINYKEGIYIGDIQTTTFNRICLMRHMCNAMIEDDMKLDIKNNNYWKDVNGNYLR